MSTKLDVRTPPFDTKQFPRFVRARYVFHVRHGTPGRGRDDVGRMAR